MSTDAPTTEKTTEKTTEELERVRMPDSNKYSPSEEDEKHKKETIAKELKAAQFAKDPDMFIHVDDVIVAALKLDRGIGIAIGRCQRQEMEMSLTRLNYKVFSLFQDLDMKAMLMAKQGGIITAPEAGKIIV